MSCIRDRACIHKHCVYNSLQWKLKLQNVQLNRGKYPPPFVSTGNFRFAQAQSVLLRNTSTHGLFMVDPTVSMWCESVIYYEDFLDQV